MYNYNPDRKYKANPSRFDEFELWNNNKGFSITENGQVIDFYFDAEMGWYDEHGYYYNAKGESASPSQSSLKWYNAQMAQFEDAGDLLDEYERAIEDEESDQDYNEDILNQAKILNDIQHLKSTVSKYEKEDKIKIEFHNVNYKARKVDFIHYIRNASTDKREIKFEFFKNEQGFFNGKGYFITSNRFQAEQIINLHGSEFFQREISLFVDPIEGVPSDDEEGEICEAIVHNQNVPESTQSVQQKEVIPQQKIENPQPQVQIENVVKQEGEKQQEQTETQKEIVIQEAKKNDEPKPIYFSDFEKNVTITEFEKWIISKFETFEQKKQLVDEKIFKNNTKAFKIIMKDIESQNQLFEVLNKLKDAKGSVCYKAKFSFKFKLG